MERRRALVLFAVTAIALVLSTIAILVLERPRAHPHAASPPAAATVTASASAAGRGPDAATAAGMLEGTVRGPSGAPHQADVLVVSTHGSAADDDDDARVVARAHAAEDGAFRVAGLAPGAYVVAAAAPGLVASARAAALGETAAPVRVDLHLAADGVPASGTVRDATGALPRAIVWARMIDDRDGAALPIEADEAGRWSATLQPGQYVLRAIAEGYAPDEEWVIATRDVTVDFVLTLGAVVRGRVVTRDGAPAPGATIVLSRTPAARRGARTTTADAGGAFEVRGLAAGAYDAAAARGPLFGRASRAVPVRAGETVEGVVVEIGRAQTIAGHVRDRAGAPVAGARVSTRASATVTGTDGAYRLEGVPAGSVDIVAEAEGHGAAHASLDVDEGRDLHGVDLVLADTIALRGKVLDAKGAPVAGATVSDDARATTVTSVEGTFDLRVRAAEVVALHAEHRGDGFATLRLVPGGRGVDDIVLALAPGATIAGKVERADGSPAAGAIVTAEGEVAKTGDDGRFVLAQVRPGDVVVRASETAERGEGGGAQLARHLSPGEHVDEVRLVLPLKGRRIEGVVVDASGAPIAGAFVGAIPEELVDDTARALDAAIADQTAAGRSLVRSGEGGAFAIADVEEGSYVVWATQSGLGRATAAHVAAGATGVRLRFAAPTRLAGVVVAADGAPHRSYRLLVRGTDVDGAPRDPQTFMVENDQGAFDLRGLEPGTYTLLAQTSDGRAARVDEVTLAEGQERDGLRLVSTGGITLEGRLLDAVTRKPITGAHIVLMGQVGSADTDDWGVFRVRGLAAEGEVRVYADDPSGDYVYDARNVALAGRRDKVTMGDAWMVRTPAREPEGEIGLVCENWDGRVVAVEVRPGSPAETAGIRAGDRVLSIESAPAGPFGEPAIDLLLRGTPGTSVSLTILRGWSGARRVSAIRALAPPHEGEGEGE